MPPRHSEPAANAARAICALYLPAADRKTRNAIAAMIDQCFRAHGHSPIGPPPPGLFDPGDQAVIAAPPYTPTEPTDDMEVSF